MPPTLTIIATFAAGSGRSTDFHLIGDAAGDLFGAAQVGGPYSYSAGTVFEIGKTGSGYASTPTVLASFTSQNTDGASPRGSLIADAAGNLIGTTFSGGANGYGTVYEITKIDGAYSSTPTVIAHLTSSQSNTFGGLFADADGNLIGTANSGGADGYGAVYEIARTNGVYSSTPITLVSFTGTNGSYPQAGLTADAAGNLFGTTTQGGTNGLGTVFEITRSNGVYSSTPTVLVSFTGPDGANPYLSGVVADAAGNLFGTTQNGGTAANYSGTVFEIAKTNGVYSSTPTVLASLDEDTGSNPAGGVIIDAAGNLFGTTIQDGPGTADGMNVYGTAYEIAKTNGHYSSTPTILASFTGDNGADPYAGLFADAAGNLFGTTVQGGSTPYQPGTGAGSSGNGTVFEITDSGFVTAIACYCAGTLILTEGGDVPVERLAIGDLLVTAAGAHRPIKWIGTRSYAGRFANCNAGVLPICFKAGSLGENIPCRDLWVSPKHAMFIDGVLIPAEHLVNGVSIVQAERTERVDYVHIELDSHDVIVAEGAPSETFVDDGSRGMFRNAHDFDALYPGAGHPEAFYCAPRVEDGFVLEAVRQRLAILAGLISAAVPQDDRGALRGSVERIAGDRITGWAQNAGRPDAPVCLDILFDGQVVLQTLAERDQDAVRDRANRFDLRLPAPLSAAEAARITVQRSADGAPLPWVAQRRASMNHATAADGG